MSIDPCVFPYADPSVTDNGRLEQCAMTLPGIMRGPDDVASTLNAYGKVTVHGKRHSQGGQTLFADAAAVDLDLMQRIQINGSQANVDAGATWDQLHQALVKHTPHMAPMAHQSSPYFSIGGSLAVNCHGRDPGQGPVSASVQELVMLLADGSTRTVMRNDPMTENRELFSLALGGYGAGGVIMAAKLNLKPERILVLRDEQTTSSAALAKWIVDRTTFTGFYHFYALLKCGDAARLFSSATCVLGIDQPQYPIYYNDPLQNDSLLTNDMVSVIYRKYRDVSLSERADQWGRLVKEIRSIPPKFLRQLNAMRDTVRFMESVPPPGPTVEFDLMQEYFIPPANFGAFLARAQKRLAKAQTDGFLTVLTSTVRFIQPDSTSLLSYSPGHRVSMVINFKARRSDAQQFANDKNPLTICMRDMIQLALDHGGSYYLCYGRFASQCQFEKAYPNAPEVRELRRKFDRDLKFTNNFLATYLESKC